MADADLRESSGRTVRLASTVSSRLTCVMRSWAATDCCGEKPIQGQGGSYRDIVA